MCIVLGDPRSNQNPALLSFGILLFKWHNVLADRVQSEHPDWSDEEVFQKARRFVVATLQVCTAPTPKYAITVICTIISLLPNIYRFIVLYILFTVVFRTSLLMNTFLRSWEQNYQSTRATNWTYIPVSATCSNRQPSGSGTR